ncbi:glycine cleavage system protein H [Methylophaga sp. OBS3]|uniref:glycine cleavage system protein H n=1 Tax=Methylophaga sp. OBS3 TaxID=2991934 RepID=UPI00224F8C7A|nr:glycine cleavage system protein H [Methylophaga sp. OBS3]MCX4189980.1 glycine cleavage system protein H [Methylophaga sp. OBS3]
MEDWLLTNQSMPTLFSKSHLWFRRLGAEAYQVGITEFYQDQLSDLHHISFGVAENTEIQAYESICTLESAKSLTEINLPFSARLKQINKTLFLDVALINQQPETEGWLFVIEQPGLSWQTKLLGDNEYQAYLDQ